MKGKALWGELAAAAALGAALMYLCDPVSGRRRRARLGRMLREPQDQALAPLPAPLAENDAQLRAQVHTRVSRLVSHPRAIDVRVKGGVVQLSGAVLAKEQDGLLQHVCAIPGVQRVVNAMTAHDFPAGIVR